MSAVDMWWFRPARGTTNFGDELGPEILGRLGWLVRRVPIAEAELIGVGSVLGLIPRQHNPSLRVWGAGYLQAGDRLQGHPRILALRGQESARKSSWDGPVGDPGVLVPLLWDEAPPVVKWKVGVVAHYVDKNRYAWADKVINPLDPVERVIQEIRQCATVASSSLHGLVVAQAYGKPVMRLEHPGVIGREFKWIDYMSGITGGIEQTQKDLLSALEE